jgi:ribulose-phosphate 3-epimerase
MVMTVEPGFGGQRFITEAAAKMSVAREWLSGAGASRQVHVDGGVNRDTASLAGAYGSDVCVVGSALFQRGIDTAREVEEVRRRAEEGRRAGVGEDAAGRPAVRV